MARIARRVSRRAAPTRTRRQPIPDAVPRARRQPVADESESRRERAARQPVPLEPDDAAQRPDLGSSIDAIVKAVRKDYGVESIIKLGDSQFEEVLGTFSTDIESLDEALGVGGWPLSKAVQVVGPESVGKSALCKKLIAQGQRAAIVPYFIDGECSKDTPERYAALGVSSANVAWSEAYYIEDAFGMAVAAIDTLKRRGDAGLIVMDSIAAFRVKERVKGQRVAGTDAQPDYDDHGGGKPEKAIFLSEHLPSLIQRIKGTRIGLVFVNQLRQKARAMPMEDPWYEVGGNALRYYCHVILRLKKGGKIGDGDGEGIKTIVSVKKSKIAPPWKNAYLDIYFDGRIENGEAPRWARS